MVLLEDVYLNISTMATDGTMAVNRLRILIYYVYPINLEIQLSIKKRHLQKKKDGTEENN